MSIHTYMHLCMHAYRYLVFGKNIFVLFSMSLQVQGRQESEGSEILVQCKCLLSQKYSAFSPHRKWNKLKRVTWRGWAAQSAIAQDVYSTTCQAAQRQAQVEHDLQAGRFNLHTTCSHCSLDLPKASTAMIHLTGACCKTSCPTSATTSSKGLWSTEEMSCHFTLRHAWQGTVNRSTVPGGPIDLLALAGKTKSEVAELVDG